MAKGENIYKRKDGRWEGRYKKGYDENKKIRYGYCYGHSYRETKEKLTQAKADYIFHGNVSKENRHTDHFSVYCEQWLKIHENRLKNSTIVKYHSMLEKHILPYLGNYSITELNSEKIIDFSNLLLYQKQLSAKTVRDILTFVHEILVYSQKNTKTQHSAITISYPKLIQKDLRVLSMEEQKYFTHYLLQDIDIYKFSVLLALLTGLRIGEICALQRKYISIEEKSLTVRHTVQRIKNPNRYSKQKTILFLGTPKTISSVRTIPIADGLIRLFQNFLSEDPESFVLTGTDQAMDPRKLQRKLKQYMAELNLHEIHFHTLRHTFATRCIEVGCDTKTLSELLGHSNISTTMNRYVHPSMDIKRKNIIKLEQAGLFPSSIEPSDISKIAVADS